MEAHDYGPEILDTRLLLPSLMTAAIADLASHLPRQALMGQRERTYESPRGPHERVMLYLHPDDQMTYGMGTWALRLVDDFVRHDMQGLFLWNAKTFYFKVAWEGLGEVAWGNLTAVASGGGVGRSSWVLCSVLS